MTLLFADSFDHYVTADITKKWKSASAANATINSSAGRRSGGCLVAQNTLYTAMLVPLSSIATVITGFALNVGVSTTGQVLLITDSTTVQCSLRWNTDGSLSFYRGNASTLLGSSAAGIVPLSTWTYVEVKVNIHNTTGTVEVRVNGSASPVINLTGQNTRSTSNNFATGISYTTVSGLNSTSFDDLVVLDTAGSTNNNFLGDIRIDALYPNGDGNYSQFTPSTGTTHYTLVDETTPNTSDYNDGASVNDRDSYTMGNLSSLASQTVYAVQTNIACAKDDAGSKSAASFIRSSSTNGDGSSVALSTSQVYISQIFETDPNGSVAWTESTVNAAEVGVLVTA